VRANSSGLTIPGFQVQDIGGFVLSVGSVVRR